MKVLRADIPQQPMGIVAVANDTNNCEFHVAMPVTVQGLKTRAEAFKKKNNQAHFQKMVGADASALVRATDNNRFVKVVTGCITRVVR